MYFAIPIILTVLGFVLAYVYFTSEKNPKQVRTLSERKFPENVNPPPSTPD
jgi:hypothetical protein